MGKCHWVILYKDGRSVLVPPHRGKWRNRGLYRFEVRKSKLYRVDAKTQFTHLMGEGVVEEINRLCIEAINKTRND